MSSSFRRRPRAVPPTSLPGLHKTSSNEGSTTTSRSAALNLRLSGTKPWTGGLTLTSTGLREIDAILGGGQPIGTCILVEEDRLTFDLGMCLARYWGAEGVAQGQVLLLPQTEDSRDVLRLESSNLNDSHFSKRGKGQNVTTSGSTLSDLNNFVNALPRDLHLDKARSRSEKKEDATQIVEGKLEEPQNLGAGFAAIDEGDEDEEDFDKEQDEIRAEEAEEGLEIAWQYRESVQRKRLGQGTKASNSIASKINALQLKEVYCHSYDLAGRMAKQYDIEPFVDMPGIDIVECLCQPCPRGMYSETKKRAFELFKSLVSRIQYHISSGGGGTTSKKVIRVLLLDAEVSVSAIVLPLLVSHIRKNSLPVAVMVTIRPWNVIGNDRAATALGSLRRAADVVFACDGFASFRDPPPSEFRDLAGILTIRKMAAMGGGHFANATSGRRPPADRYGFKRDRRKLHVRLLHLPPEEESSGGGSTSGVRSGGGKATEGSNTPTKTALEPGAGCSGASKKASSISLEF